LEQPRAAASEVYQSHFRWQHGRVLRGPM